MSAANFEYVALRLIRRFVFNRWPFSRLLRLIPHYLANTGETDPAAVVSIYESRLREAGKGLEGRIVLEIGSGATRSTAYALLAAGASRVYAFEPIEAFDGRLDRKWLDEFCRRSGKPESFFTGGARRLKTLDSIEPASVDRVVSHSVLEHVGDLDPLFSRLARLLKPDGVMVHRVDYRDHFFKYPYHFLQFSQKRWDRYLNPGDLTRKRLSDHLAALDRHGFTTRVTERERDLEAFNRIRDLISPDFNRSDPELSVLKATLISSLAPK